MDTADALGAIEGFFEGFNARDLTHEAVWVVTQLDGHWGVQARSSFAPQARIVHEAPTAVAPG